MKDTLRVFAMQTKIRTGYQFVVLPHCNSVCLFQQCLKNLQ